LGFKPAEFSKALSEKAVDLIFSCRRPFIADALFHSLANSGKQPDSGENPFFSRHHPRLSHFREEGEAGIVGDPVIHGRETIPMAGALQAGA
jgi:hypothetical protein